MYTHLLLKLTRREAFMKEKPLQVPLIYLRGKQLFAKDAGVMRLVGKPTDVAKKLSEKEYKLLHIIDLDSSGSISPNFDVYDDLTSFINIQVECSKGQMKIEFAKSLTAIKSRVVIKLPASFDLLLSKNERLLVGRISSEYVGSVDGIYDLIIDGANDETIKRFNKTKKRLITYQKDYEKLKKENQKLIWAVIFDFDLAT